MRPLSDVRASPDGSGETLLARAPCSWRLRSDGIPELTLRYAGPRAVRPRHRQVPGDPASRPAVLASRPRS
jgi:hypothetical protein